MKRVIKTFKRAKDYGVFFEAALQNLKAFSLKALGFSVEEFPINT